MNYTYYYRCIKTFLSMRVWCSGLGSCALHPEDFRSRGLWFESGSGQGIFLFWINSCDDPMVAGKGLIGLRPSTAVKSYECKFLLTTHFVNTLCPSLTTIYLYSETYTYIVVKNDKLSIFCLPQSSKRISQDRRQWTYECLGII